MYNNRFSSRRSNPPRHGGHRFGGVRRIKTFDPSNVIKAPQVVQKVQEYKVNNSFNDFGLESALVKNIIQHGYANPTPIQDKAIPVVLKGNDLIGIANTGTGKTAAFLIPLINQILLDRNKRVLIMAPTRELAAQIRDEFYSFSNNLNVYCVLCIGGGNMRRQIDNLRRNPNIVIGTPGRIKDLLKTGNLNVSKFTTVILDEADHMVDIGFIHDIKFMISLLPKNRQSLFFSATIDGKVSEIIKGFVNNPVTISVKTNETSENVEQKTIKVLDNTKKVEQLHQLLIQKEFEKVLVFGRTKYGVQRLSDELIKRGFKADAIHGNKNQNQRMRTLDKFKRNEIQILLATDVASRGLDIPNVSHVINYELPESYEAYVHRIGRTGRADKKGVALTFVT